MALQQLRNATSRIEKTHLRRGAMFMVNIAAPTLYGALTGRGTTALLGGMAALVLSFADNEFDLPRRLWLLLASAACMAGGGLAGFYLHGTPTFLWPGFVAIAFGVGMAARYGRELLIVTRNGVIAFTAAAGFPGFDAFDAQLLAGVLLLTAITRAIDHGLFGPLPRSAAPPQPQRPTSHLGWIRFAVCYAAAGAAALWIGLTLDPTRAIWVVTATMIVMQADAQLSYQRIVERIEGTFLGVLAAWAFASAISEKWMLCALALAVTPFIPHHVGQRYWLHTALIALFVLLMYGYAAPSIHELDVLLGERLKDMLIGCAVAVIGTALAFPRRGETSGDEIT
jgi:hypothetical protein